MLVNKRKIFIWFFALSGIGLFVSCLLSCGKAGNASPTGLNIQYHVLNLSPDMNPVGLYVDNKQVNSNPYIYGVDQGYFYVPSTDTPYQIRSIQYNGTTLLHSDALLQSGAKYSLYIVGAIADRSDTALLTVDTDKTPGLGHGKLRFINASPTGTGGLDVYVNDTLGFKHIVYKKYSNYLVLPIGNYDLKINATGSSSVLKELPGITIQDGRLYTLYAFGYTTRADTAGFNAATITNR
jgi:hypothetical protein